MPCGFDDHDCNLCDHHYRGTCTAGHKDDHFLPANRTAILQLFLTGYYAEDATLLFHTVTMRRRVAMAFHLHEREVRAYLTTHKRETR
jgi:hypothetical protein